MDIIEDAKLVFDFEIAELKKTRDTIDNEIEIAKIKSNLAEQIKAKVEKNQKEYILREQLGYIREELGENSSYSDAEQFDSELKKLKAILK